MSDLATQLQQAILVDFFGPADRLQRLLGLSDTDEDKLFDALEPDPGIAELMRPAHHRGRALLQLAAERHGDGRDDEVMATAIEDVRRALREMEAWSR